MSPSITLLLALTLSSTGLASSLGAQRRSQVAITPGSTVRVLVSERPPGKLEGAFVGADSAGVRVVERSNGTTVAIDWANMRLIDVRVARRSSMEAFGRGAKAGAIVFGTIAVIGLATAIAWDANDGCEGIDYCIPATAVAIPLGYLVTVGGTAAGGLLGLVDRDRWRKIWPEPR